VAPRTRPIPLPPSNEPDRSEPALSAADAIAAPRASEGAWKSDLDQGFVISPATQVLSRRNALELEIEVSEALLASRMLSEADREKLAGELEHLREFAQRLTDWLTEQQRSLICGPGGR
jgi:hypothetical protein